MNILLSTKCESFTNYDFVFVVPMTIQVVNYGIGGQYEPHYDFARVDEDAFSDHGAGNRIATVLFYVSKTLLVLHCSLGENILVML